jgi:hypothetical protein
VDLALDAAAIDADAAEAAVVRTAALRQRTKTLVTLASRRTIGPPPDLAEAAAQAESVSPDPPLNPGTILR